jgi:catechol 2,3-dioxygenase-like lactoylglutathione lyase family enzyme
MKKLICRLSFAALTQVGPVLAQLAPVNETGLSMGHLHLAAPDREKEAKAWLALGGQLENNLSGNIPIGFPGVVVLVGQSRPVSAGSAGSVVDHVAFRVASLDTSLAKWKGVETWWKAGSWGLKIEPGTKPGQAFVTTPAGTKCEILEDKALKVPIVFDHVHYYVEESRIREMEDYYAKMFGAKPVKGEPDSFSVPGAKLIFTRSATPPAETMGRSLDHIGFNMLNADVLKAFSATLEQKGAKLQRPYESSSMGMIRVLDGFGTIVEVTKAQGGYFDLKLLDPAYFQVDEGGRKQGETPAHPR